MNRVGDKIAYIMDENGSSVIRLVSTGNLGLKSDLVRTVSYIDTAKFVGQNWIAYTYIDSNNYAKLCVIDLQNKNILNIFLSNNMKTIKIITTKGIDDFVVACYGEKRYFIYKISVPSLKIQKLKEDLNPLEIVFDNRLIPVLYYKKFDGLGADVYLCGPSGSTKNERLIDHITNVTQEKYISVSGNYCYKLKLQSGSAQLITTNLGNNSQKRTDIGNVSKLSDISVYSDKNGLPLLISVNKARRTNIPLNNSLTSSINAINSQFVNSDWYMLDSTIDENLWLLRISSPQNSNKYYLFNRKNNGFTEIATANKNLPGIPLIQSKFVQIPIGTNGRSVYGYITNPVNSTTNTPLILIVESEGKYRFNWEFNPTAQMLANRGYRVLCANCCTTDITNNAFTPSVVQSISSEINAVSDWCINNRWAMPGNISLVGSRKNCECCMSSFITKQNTFSSCVLMHPEFLTNGDILSNVNILQTLSKPILIIDNYSNSFRYKNLFFNRRKDIPLSYITYGKKPKSMNVAGLLERFFSNVHRLAKEDISAQGLVEFSALFDGYSML
jgi:hypothetical protein